MDLLKASAVMDPISEKIMLSPEAQLRTVRVALATESLDFPIVREGKYCMGFTTRARLESALTAHEDDLSRSDSEAGFLGLGASQNGKALLDVLRIAEKPPFMIPEGMPAPRLFSLFSRAGARAAAVVSETGVFQGMITRQGLIEVTRCMHKGQPHAVASSKGADEARRADSDAEALASDEDEKRSLVNS